MNTLVEGPTLIGGRITRRPGTHADADALAANRAEPSVWVRWRAPIRAEIVAKFYVITQLAGPGRPSGTST